MAKKQTGSVKRFGTRYGKTVKQRLAKVERQSKKTYKCPFCSYEAVKRKANGIWECTKCDSTFTGKAYTVQRKQKTRVEPKDEDEE